MSDKYKINKPSMARSFGHSAASYDEVAVLQREAGDELLDRLSLVTLKPERILDLGTGTGRNLIPLMTRYPDAQILAMDLAGGMIEQAKSGYRRDIGLKRWLPRQIKPHFILGDAESIPLADNSVDLVFTNLTLQWCDLRSSFSEIARILRPEGLLMFTTLGPDTLYELRQAWAYVDDKPHVNVFYDMHDVAEAMTSTTLSAPVLDTDRYVLTYSSVQAMMKDLKSLGAHNVAQGRQRGLTPPSALKKMIDQYEHFRENDVLPASYEVIFGHAWRSQESLQQGDHSTGEFRISIDQIQRRRS